MLSCWDRSLGTNETNASALKHEIETLLGLAGAEAASFWRIAASAMPAAAPNFHAFPDFAGGVRVANTVANARQSPTPPAIPGPVPIPYPNFSAGTPVTIQGAGKHFDGDYVLTSVQHTVPPGSYKDELIDCVCAAAAGDAHALR